MLQLTMAARWEACSRLGNDAEMAPGLIVATKSSTLALG
jgi:hypothetical protein